jgi:hypothetical protein
MSLYIARQPAVRLTVYLLKFISGVLNEYVYLLASCLSPAHLVFGLETCNYYYIYYCYCLSQVGLGGGSHDDAERGPTP